MPSFSVDTTITAPPPAVWRALAAIGDIAHWNPGVVASHVTTEQASGVGAGRHCVLGGNNYLDEQVVEWEADHRLTMRVVGTNLPFARADIRFTLQPADGGTRVTVAPDYALKFGPVGRLLDVVVVRRQYRRGMEALLRGLKRHVERAATTT